MQMKHLLLLASLLTCMGAGAQQATFRNPVIAGDMADPTVIRVDNTYYATGTSSEWAPYYPLFRSKDLVNWRQIGHLFEQQPAWTRSSFWAPELFHRNGKTYAYYTARRKTDGTSYIGVATADKPEGPYTDHGPIVEYGTEAIDAFVLEDAGELYISWKAYGLDPRPIELLACKISDDGLRMAGEPFTLLRDDKRQGMEGQHWLKIGDYYYIVYSINGCCGPGSDYAVAVARSKNLRGPYERYAGNPILHGGGDVQSFRIDDCPAFFQHLFFQAADVQIGAGENLHGIGGAGTAAQGTGNGFGHRQAVGGNDRGNNQVCLVAGNFTQAMVVGHDFLAAPVDDAVAAQGFGQGKKLVRRYERAGRHQERGNIHVGIAPRRNVGDNVFIFFRA